MWRFVSFGSKGLLSYQEDQADGKEHQGFTVSFMHPGFEGV